MIWNVAGGLKYSNIFLNLLKYQYKSYNISVFDAPSELIWSGGRIVNINHSLDECINIIKEYNNNNNIGFNFTFSNTLLTEEHLKDEDCNYILSKTENEMNGVITGSKILKDYIKLKYPKFKQIASICNMNKDYNKLCEEYDTVVLNPDDNRNYEMIAKLKYPEKIEILVNEWCRKNCEFRKKHYIDMSRIILNKKTKTLEAVCHYGKDSSRKGELILNSDEISKLTKLGIKRFKIQGRDNPIEQIKKRMEYFIKQEYI